MASGSFSGVHVPLSVYQLGAEVASAREHARSSFAIVQLLGALRRARQSLDAVRSDFNERADAMTPADLSAMSILLGPVQRTLAVSLGRVQRENLALWMRPVYDSWVDFEDELSDFVETLQLGADPRVTASLRHLAETICAARPTFAAIGAMV